MHVYGANVAVGYDVACAFATTVQNSSLGPHAKEARLLFVVLAFHGYAHNTKCQLQWHPLYLRGFGIEDFEVCERVFKGSNALASVIRHATRFHCHQALDMYFRQHDEDKYELLCKSTVHQCLT
jgi:Kyakuja-Dileera-Zisupton transposase